MRLSTNLSIRASFAATTPKALNRFRLDAISYRARGDHWLFEIQWCSTKMIKGIPKGCGERSIPIAFSFFPPNLYGLHTILSFSYFIKQSNKNY